MDTRGRLVLPATALGAHNFHPWEEKTDQLQTKYTRTETKLLKSLEDLLELSKISEIAKTNSSKMQVAQHTSSIQLVAFGPNLAL